MPLALLALGLAGGPAAGATAAAASLLANGTFATGSTAGWTCSPGDTVVTSPVAPGCLRAADNSKRPQA